MMGTRRRRGLRLHPPTSCTLGGHRHLMEVQPRCLLVRLEKVKEGRKRQGGVRAEAEERRGKGLWQLLVVGKETRVVFCRRF